MKPAAPVAVVVAGSGAICSVGVGIAQVYASVRAGIARKIASEVVDREFEPITMALLPDAALEPLDLEVARHGLSGRQSRMLSLAATAIRESVTALPVAAQPVRVFLGLPEPTPAWPSTPPWFLEALATQAGVAVDLAQSRMFPCGRAAALVALEAAVQAISSGQANHVLVGGVDSFMDLDRLSELLAEERICPAPDGFIPGEGAAFVLLANRRGLPSGGKSNVAVLAVGKACDPGHLYSSQPGTGEGLATAIETMVATSAALPGPICNTYAGLNGESFGAKEWGVAALRHRPLFSPDAQMDHPADCYGDVGAATGAILVALASTALARGDRLGPSLVWSSSDGEDCACAVMDVQTQER